MMDRDGQNIRFLDRIGKDIEFAGWMDNNSLVYRDHWGNGNWKIYVVDINMNTLMAWAAVHAAGMRDLSEQFVVTENGRDVGNMFSAAVFSKEAIRPEQPDDTPLPGIGPYLNQLSLSDGFPIEVYFNSRFEDWIAESNQMLVLTWEAEDFLGQELITGNPLTNLQLWDVDTEVLTLIVPNGIYGRFSPDGTFLFTLTPNHNTPNSQLLNRETGNVLLSLSVYATMVENQVEAYTTFSPNGRFLTFFNPAHELIIYDLENGEFLAPVTAVPTTPLWSPDGSRFVYQHPEAGLSIFDTRSATAYPLALSGSDRLLDPQWSFDGTYLSVTVLQENWWERETAVLQIP